MSAKPRLPVTPPSDCWWNMPSWRPGTELHPYFADAETLDAIHTRRLNYLEAQMEIPIPQEDPLPVPDLLQLEVAIEELGLQMAEQFDQVGRILQRIVQDQRRTHAKIDRLADFLAEAAEGTDA